jgi:hypothetical protein
VHHDMAQGSTTTGAPDRQGECHGKERATAASWYLHAAAVLSGDRHAPNVHLPFDMGLSWGQRHARETIGCVTCIYCRIFLLSSVCGEAGSSRTSTSQQVLVQVQKRPLGAWPAAAAARSDAHLTRSVRGPCTTRRDRPMICTNGDSVADSMGSSTLQKCLRM